MSDLTEYSGLLTEIKARIQMAQTRAVLRMTQRLANRPSPPTLRV